MAEILSTQGNPGAFDANEQETVTTWVEGICNGLQCVPYRLQPSILSSVLINMAARLENPLAGFDDLVEGARAGLVRVIQREGTAGEA